MHLSLTLPSRKPGAILAQKHVIAQASRKPRAKQTFAQTFAQTSRNPKIIATLFVLHNTYMWTYWVACVCLLTCMCIWICTTMCEYICIYVCVYVNANVNAYALVYVCVQSNSYVPCASARARGPELARARARAREWTSQWLDREEDFLSRSFLQSRLRNRPAATEIGSFEQSEFRQHLVGRFWWQWLIRGKERGVEHVA